jgi:hypothetical protein
MSHQRGGAYDAAALPGSGGGASGVGATLAQILSLAEAESAEVRHKAVREAEAIVAEARVAADELRTQADRYATTRRVSSEQDAAATLDAARRRAEQLLQAADEQLAHMREQSELSREQAHADVETIEARRAQLEHDLRERLDLARRRAEADRAAVRELRAIEESIREQRDQGRLVADAAEAHARRVIADAQDEAFIARARLAAELADARRRSDAIHRHLSEIGQMLADLADASPRSSVAAAARRSRAHRAAPRYKWVLAGNRRVVREAETSDRAATQRA